MNKLGLFIFIIILLSCSNHSTNVKDLSDEILPLKVGNKWYMKNVTFDSLGNSSTPFYFSLVVSKDTLINREKWYGITVECDFCDESSISYYAKREDGIYILNENNEAFLVYKYPAVVNETYISDSVSVKIKSLSLNITVESGKYECVEYEISEVDNTLTRIYLSVGVGFVKFEHYSKTIGGEIFISQINELVSSKIN